MMGRLVLTFSISLMFDSGLSAVGNQLSANLVLAIHYSPKQRSTNISYQFSGKTSAFSILCGYFPNIEQRLITQQLN